MSKTDKAVRVAAAFMFFAAIFVYFVMVIDGCGDDSTKTVYRKPDAEQPDDAWAKIKPIVDKNCAGCHDGVKQKPALTSAAAFKGSNAKARIEAGTMPPSPRKLEADDKAQLLTYLGG